MREKSEESIQRPDEFTAEEIYELLTDDEEKDDLGPTHEQFLNSFRETDKRKDKSIEIPGEPTVEEVRNLIVKYDMAIENYKKKPSDNKAAAIVELNEKLSDIRIELKQRALEPRIDDFFTTIAIRAGYSNDEMPAFISRNDDIFNTLNAIHDAGLTNLFFTDTGIYDILAGSETPEELKNILDTAINNIRYGYVKKSKAEILLRYAKSDAPIIILGETGTGKELFANLIHSISKRKDQPFIKINATGLTATLFESELFGYEKGSFTGALKSSPGLIQAANKGTFFIDELGKMPKSFQAKLLRVIENKEVRKIGAVKGEKIDIRFIVALHQEEIDKKKALPDLLYRLKYPDAIRMLSLNQELKKYGKKVVDRALYKVSSEIFPRPSEQIYCEAELINFLVRRKYKGNYRELENILHHAIMNRDPYRMDCLTMACIKELIEDKYFMNVAYETEASETKAIDNPYPTMELSKSLTEESSLEPLFIENDAITIKLDYENIKLTDIVSHIEKVGSLIVRGMVMHTHRRIGDFKKAISVNNPTVNYCNYMNKLKLRLGMNIYDFVKKYTKDRAMSATITSKE
ncbi:MAG: sigma-54 factor interaction domain-containing protein [Pseudomonadota bacterium]